MLHRGGWLVLTLFAVGCVLDLDRFDSRGSGGGGADNVGGATSAGGTGGEGGRAPTPGCDSDTPWTMRLGYDSDDIEVQSLAVTPDCGAVVVIRSRGNLGALDAGFIAMKYDEQTVALRILRLESTGSVRWRRLLYSTESNGQPQMGAGSLFARTNTDGDLVWELAGWGYGEIRLDGGPAISVSDAKMGYVATFHDAPENAAERLGSLRTIVRGASDEHVRVRTVDADRELISGNFSGTLTFEGFASPELTSQAGQFRQGFLGVLDDDPNNGGSLRARALAIGDEVRIQRAIWSGETVYLIGDFLDLVSLGNVSVTHPTAGTAQDSRSAFIVRLDTSNPDPNAWSGDKAQVLASDGRIWVQDAFRDGDKIRVLLAVNGTPSNTTDYPTAMGGELVVADYAISNLTLEAIRHFPNTRSTLGTNFPPAGLVGPKFIRVRDQTLIAGAFASSLNYGPVPTTSGANDEDGFLISIDGTSDPLMRFYQDPTGREIVEAVAGNDETVYTAVTFSGNSLDLGDNLIQPFSPTSPGPNTGRHVLIERIVLP